MIAKMSLPSTLVLSLATSSTSPTLTPTVKVISTAPDLRSFLASIQHGCSLYIDLEGKSLSRQGTLTIITILIYPLETVGVIDIQTLGSLAFTTPSMLNHSTTLKSIFEDPASPNTSGTSAMTPMP